MTHCLFPMHGTEMYNIPERLKEKQQITYDASQEKVNRAAFRQMYNEKHFMEEMLKAKNMATEKK